MKSRRYYSYLITLFFMTCLTSCKVETKKEATPEPDQITKDIIRDSVKKIEEVPINDLNKII